ncbi:Gfo/Idh/MocA family protein [Aureimonas sp. AU20]|uniref:Gfo/Idh/MocA family protein n=1 Tax=Aureimonas sp. AU20 TaxID=1349819 RepID=UPI0007227B2E|nr:Gfo/Idh/MocA family oxidoreductase [Aureimonas sp. AU20]ALN71857.1 hypothetical protein M673_03965 [Aureimonas sp. AU20]
MTKQPFRVGIVGLQPGRSWAARAHLPALQALPEDFEIAGVANTSRASAERAVAETGLPRAYDDVAELVGDASIDVVAVTVKVPHHRAIVGAALAAGKHVYCEWPLGNGLAEAEELAALARTAGVVAVTGIQARLAPEVRQLVRLVAEGYVGKVLSTTIVARGGGWGGMIASRSTDAYLLDRSTGANMLTIPIGHTLAAVHGVLGDVAGVSAVLTTRRATALAADTGETLPVSAPDQVLVSGLLADGSPLSLHYRGGMARDGQGFLWEINGTDGDLRLSAPFGHPQLLPLTLTGGRGDDRSFQPIDVPPDLLADLPADPTYGNVARTYALMAEDIRQGTQKAPSFDDAVTIHRIIDAIERSSADGRAVDVSR